MNFNDANGERYDLDHKCFKTGMKRYLRVPAGTGSPKPRPAEGCS